MRTETTLNIDYKLLCQLNKKKDALQVTNSLIFEMLMKELFRRFKTKNSFKRVRYQQRRNKEEWETFHVAMDNRIYERAMDMKKLHKMSVSYLFAMAIILYLDDISDCDETDNYGKNYICIVKKYEDIFSYTVFWDYPDNKILEHFL